MKSIIIISVLLVGFIFVNTFPDTFSEEVFNATNIENSAAGLNATSAAGVNATSAVPSEETDVQNLMLILIGIVIAAAIASIVVRSRKRQTATPAKGSKTKKFCRKCGSSLDPKSKFCGKCGVSINPKK